MKIFCSRRNELPMVYFFFLSNCVSLKEIHFRQNNCTFINFMASVCLRTHKLCGNYNGVQTNNTMADKWKFPGSRIFFCSYFLSVMRQAATWMASEWRRRIGRTRTQLLNEIVSVRGIFIINAVCNRIQILYRRIFIGRYILKRYFLLHIAPLETFIKIWLFQLITLDRTLTCSKLSNGRKPSGYDALQTVYLISVKLSLLIAVSHSFSFKTLSPHSISGLSEVNVSRKLFKYDSGTQDQNNIFILISYNWLYLDLLYKELF